MTETKYISSKMAAAHCLPDQEGLVKRLRWFCLKKKKKKRILTALYIFGIKKYGRAVKNIVKNRARILLYTLPLRM